MRAAARSRARNGAEADGLRPALDGQRVVVGCGPLPLSMVQVLVTVPFMVAHFGLSYKRLFLVIGLNTDVDL